MRKLLVLLILPFVIGCTQSAYMQGRRLADEGKYDQAIDMLYSEIKVNPQSADAWRELGIAFYKKGDLMKAEDALKQAIAIRPDARSNLYLGLMYEKQEMYDKAIDAYRAGLGLGPKSDIKNMTQAHLDLLISKRINQEAAAAISGEKNINVDTIPTNTIAVVDFDNSHLTPELAPISKGLAEFTAIDLSKVHSLRVVDRTKLDAILGELKLSASQYSDPAYSPRVGRLIGSRRVVTGSVTAIGDKQIRLDGAIVNTVDSGSAMTSPTEGD